jgi:hypothetical protein
MTDIDSCLERFSKQHSVVLDSLPEAERLGIYYTLRCQDAIDAGLAALSADVLSSDAVVGVARQLLARCAEHVEGALAAFATSSGASAELIARVAIESSVTIRFILRDPQPRLAAYFRHHVDDVDKQVRHWRNVAASLPGDAKVIPEAACDQRDAANRAMRSFVDRLEQELIGSRAPEKWPAQVSERFRALDDEVTYRTVYARLCSETHFDAEETLRYGLGQLGGDELLERMALETIGFTRLMISIAVTYFLHAALDYASRYSMNGTMRECQAALHAMRRISEVLSEHVDGGQGGADTKIQ